MPITCIVWDCINKPKRYSSISFHSFPKSYRRRRVWFDALGLDPSTREEEWKKWRVCSEHFTEDDYNESGLHLNDKATPTIQKSRHEQTASSFSAEKLGDVHLNIPKTEEIFFAGVPHSTPEKHKDEKMTSTFKLQPFKLQPTNPVHSTKSAVSLAPTWTKQSDAADSSMIATCSTHKSVIFEDQNPTEDPEVDVIATSMLDVSMTSEPVDIPMDSSYLPDSSPSTSSTGSSSSLSGQPTGCKERKWIVNESKLMELFQKCPTCSSVMCDLNLNVAHTGCRISINWHCNNGHTGQWESCPNVRGMAENNLLASAATLFTGSTYSDIADWAGLLNLQLPHTTSFYNIQSSYLIPVIEEAYIKQEDIIKARLICQSEDGEGVQLCGDGRSDSPGHSSKYTTYSFMDDSTKHIVVFELMQVSQASSSVAMEPLCFRTGLEKILNEGIDVKVVTTDRHPSIRKIMREEYPYIMHQFDPWHVAKGFKKKMVAASNRKECRDLAPWVRSVSNHMWWSCCTSKGDTQELLRRWMSLQYHITGVHRWEENDMEYRCFHKDLTEQEQRSKKWLKVNSPSFKALKSMMMDTRLLNDLQQMTLFKHTGQLEVFHSALLKYCPKRLHFQYSAMKARTMLAIMDHNENHSSEREQLTTATGLQRSNVVFNKQSKQWISKPVYADTTQQFRDGLMERVVQRRLDSRVTFKDPSSRIRVPHLAANIASVPKPSKEEAQQSHTSRFKGPLSKE